MGTRNAIKMIHLASTVLFMLCLGYVFILAMLQAGFNWFVIFSLSSQSALIVVLLVSLYLFAMFRGVSPSNNTQKEHPLTSTSYYIAFYISAPFLGAIAGILSMIGTTKVGSLPGGIALGAIGATFLTWVVVDPVTGLLESLAPEPKKHRVERLARMRIQKQLEQENRKKMLDRVFEQEKENERQWRESFASHADRLVFLLGCENNNFTKAEQEAISIGVEAWKKGGLICMKYVRDMAKETFKQRYGEQLFVDYISAWWDGIGRWRKPSLQLQ
jgi:hypothetical protein